MAAESAYAPPPLGAGVQSNGRIIPVLAVDVAEACAALGVGWDFWNEHVAPEVRVVRRGRRKLIAVAELSRWLDDNAELVLGDDR